MLFAIKFCCGFMLPLSFFIVPFVYLKEHPRSCCTLCAFSDIFVLSLMWAPSDVNSSCLLLFSSCSSCLFGHDLWPTSVLLIMREFVLWVVAALEVSFAVCCRWEMNGDGCCWEFWRLFDLGSIVVSSYGWLGVVGSVFGGFFVVLPRSCDGCLVGAMAFNEDGCPYASNS